MAEAPTPRGGDDRPLQRRAVVAEILRERGERLVVSGLGAPTWDVAAAGDTPRTFPLWGAMGGAVMVGLGLALAQPAQRVLVITGDGEMLMGIGALATVAAMAPENLAIVVLDNERYGETGMQATHTAGVCDLAGIAIAAGLPRSRTVRSHAELEAALPEIRDATGPVFVDIKVTADDLPLVTPPKDGTHLKERFRRAVLGADA